jgi:hypothetical protein
MSRLTYFGLGGGGGSRILDGAGFTLELENYVKPVLRKGLE